MITGQRLAIGGVLLGCLVLAVMLYNLSGIFYEIEAVHPDEQTIWRENYQPNFSSEQSGVGETFSASLQECAVSRKYPRRISRWCEMITRYSDQHGLPPDLVAAVIFQESGGFPDAISSSGAVGLMQVMPRDGVASNFVCTNGPCFQDRPPSKKLIDPEFNIKYGTRMLASLLNRHGNIREALRAYGPLDVGYSYADQVLGVYNQNHQ